MTTANEIRQYLNEKAAELVSDEGFANYKPMVLRFRDRVSKAAQLGGITFQELDAIEDWLRAVHYFVDRPHERPKLPQWPVLETKGSTDDSHVPVQEMSQEVSGDGPGEGDAEDGTVSEVPDPFEEDLRTGCSACDSGHAEEALQGGIAGGVSDDRVEVGHQGGNETP